MSIIIRKGTPNDLNQAFELVQELAEYENALHEVENSVERMMEDGFGKKPIFEFFVAEENGKIEGTAIFLGKAKPFFLKTWWLEKPNEAQALVKSF